MARAIDADNVLERIENIAQHWQKQGKKYEAMLVPSVMKSIIDSEPALTPPNEWVSVEDELPARDGIYLVYTTRGSVTTAHFYAEKIFRDDYKRKASWQGNRNVTHWTPLPAPPDSRPPEVRT